MKYDQTGKKRAIAGYLPLIRLIIKLLIKLNILLIEKKFKHETWNRFEKKINYAKYMYQQLLICFSYVWHVVTPSTVQSRSAELAVHELLSQTKQSRRSFVSDQPSCMLTIFLVFFIIFPVDEIKQARGRGFRGQEKFTRLNNKYVEHEAFHANCRKSISPTSQSNRTMASYGRSD